jgi:PTH1 family peptidyl-tRNA hydrolase
MKLVVGLGNPGTKYRKTRHNIGFLVLEKYFSEHSLSFKKQKNFDYAEHKGTIFIKPKTYMNLSGNAVTAAKTKFKIDEVMIIVDDIYLPWSEIRLRRNGGLAGHNGLKSIATALGSKDFFRFRVGIGSPEQTDLSQYVLSDFSQTEQKEMKIVLDYTQQLLDKYVDADFDEMMKYYSKTKKSYSEEIIQTQDRSVK